MNARRLTVTASDSSPRGRVLLGALTALALVCAMALAGSAPALAAECLNEKEESNEALRSEENSALLPQCRVYEQVSPVYTADRGVAWWEGAAPNGEAAEFLSKAGFAGARSNYGFEWYIARRVKEVGWQTSWVGLPATLIQGEAQGTDVSFDLTKALVREQSLSVPRPPDSLFVSDDLAAAPAFTFTEVAGFDAHGGAPDPQAETPDFSHAIVVYGYFFVYEFAGVGGPAPEPPPQLVNVDSAGNVLLGGLGDGGSGNSSAHFHALSNDGAEVFFTSNGVSYVRVNGSNTLKLGGLFRGASEDGSKAFFIGGGNGLYMDVIDSKPGQVAVTKKVSISQGAPATLLRSSNDGSHVYFVSEGVLGAKASENENEYKEKAQAGHNNLYVYDTVTEKYAFIAQALPGGELSVPRATETQVNSCPSAELKEAVEPGCEEGRFFVFATTAKITPDDSSSAQQVFEYDAKSGRLARVSLGEDGYDKNGNGGAGGASIAVSGEPNTAENSMVQAEDSTRAVSDDGKTVVFTSAQALSPRAVNGQPDVYEYHEGQVGMISTGHSLTPDSEVSYGKTPAITQSGRDVFFISTENILPQDSDGLAHLYDARIDGGFPAAAVKKGVCNGDACQGPPSVPNLLAANGSATFSGLGNPTPPASTPAVKPKTKPKPKKCKKNYVRKKGRCVKKPKPKKKATKSSRDRRIK